MAKVIINYCDKCNEKTDDLKDVALNTPQEYIKRELCDKCYKEYNKKIIELGEWLKKNDFEE